MKNLWKDESGATAIEYALIAAAIAGTIIVVAYLLGNKTDHMLKKFEKDWGKHS